MNQCYAQFPEISDYASRFHNLLWGSIPVILAIWGSLCALKIVKSVFSL